MIGVLAYFTLGVMAAGSAGGRAVAERHSRRKRLAGVDRWSSIPNDRAESNTPDPSLLHSPELAAQRHRELRLPRERAAALGRSAVEAIRQGIYSDETGGRVDWRGAVEAARAAKRSLRPEDPLPRHDRAPFPETHLQVTNETTLGAAERLAARSLTPLALRGPRPGPFLHTYAAHETFCQHIGCTNRSLTC